MCVCVLHPSACICHHVFVSAWITYIKFMQLISISCKYLLFSSFFFELILLFPEFSESLRELGSCLLEKTALNDDEDSGKCTIHLFMIWTICIGNKNITCCHYYFLTHDVIHQPTFQLLHHLDMKHFAACSLISCLT